MSSFFLQQSFVFIYTATKKKKTKRQEKTKTKKKNKQKKTLVASDALVVFRVSVLFVGGRVVARLLVDFVDLGEHRAADAFELHASVLEPHLNQRNACRAKRSTTNALPSLAVRLD